ncbi:DNA-binding response regulator [Pedobacter yonginense]|uniref:DNA-binding response regulator n=1 Tax=Pedobacter yonginense TaxID=651869 RepID=A0A317ELU8_9SPHI|nr:LytTR family DNA-binding domain-containing protein [Pedobacter yonginense]PWS27137.1 DNA-binding response regulator [Pedobacter yonginense]
MIKCIAIDDQQDSLSGLEQYISDTPHLNLIASYTNPLIALNEIPKNPNVELIFVDINMPHISGLELAKAIRAKTKKLIFTTSHQEYAFEAFEAEADAYLLKPYSYAKFLLTTNRLFNDVTETPAFKENGKKDEYFLVKNKEEEHKTVLVRYDEIVAFESFHNYVKIHTTKKTIIAYLSLKDVREQLDLDGRFIQLHRGYIIAVGQIQHIESNKITLSNKINFNVGDIYQPEFREFLTNKIITSNRKK